MKGILHIQADFTPEEAESFIEGLGKNYPNLMIIISSSDYNSNEAMQLKYIPFKKSKGKPYWQFKKMLNSMLVKANVAIQEREKILEEQKKVWRKEYGI